MYKTVKPTELVRIELSGVKCNGLQFHLTINGEVAHYIKKRINIRLFLKGKKEYDIEIKDLDFIECYLYNRNQMHNLYSNGQRSIVYNLRFGRAVSFVKGDEVFVDFNVSAIDSTADVRSSRLHVRNICDNSFEGKMKCFVQPISQGTNVIEFSAKNIEVLCVMHMADEGSTITTVEVETESGLNVIDGRAFKALQVNPIITGDSYLLGIKERFISGKINFAGDGTTREMKLLSFYWDK